MPNSDDITVSLPADATIIKTVTGTVSDLKEGQRLTVMGARSGNNVAATAVQVTDLPDGINVPGFGGGARGGARPPHAGPVARRSAATAMRTWVLRIRAVDRPIFDALVDGRKTIETRAGSPGARSYTAVQPGDTLCSSAARPACAAR